MCTCQMQNTPWLYKNTFSLVHHYKNQQNIYASMASSDSLSLLGLFTASRAHMVAKWYGL